MNKYLKRAVLTVCTLLCCATLSQAQNFTFPESSVMAGGNWVKFGIESSGVHEITYDQLREMGFENPECVGVYGQGGRALPGQFTDRNGVQYYTTDPNPVSVLHRNNKLYFYARGTEVINYSTNPSLFVLGQRNVYTNKGYYFLSDYREPQTIKEAEVNDRNISNQITSGLDYFFYDDDLVQNCTGTGNVFWGPSFVKGTSRYEWPCNIPFVDFQGYTAMDCRIYASKNAAGNIRFGIDTADRNASYALIPPATDMFKYQTPSICYPVLDDTPSRVFVEVTDTKGSYINLDNWIVTYTKRVPDFGRPEAGIQERLTITSAFDGSGYLNYADNGNLLTFDITDSIAPRLLPIQTMGERRLHWVDCRNGRRDLITFDTSRTQPGIADNGRDWHHVANQNLHSLRAEGADLLILSVPKYRKYAEEIADIHRQHDRLKVIVVDPDDVYNEFSGGLPDPMAYRGLAKLLHESAEHPLRNMLFIGPIYGDYRGMEDIHKNIPGFIGYQGPLTSGGSEAPNAMDFYGMTDDNPNLGLSYSRPLQEWPVNVGVGILPVNTEEEMIRVTDKIRQYCSATNQAWIVNETLSVGGIGDAHTHDEQAINITDYIQSRVPAQFAHSILCIDAYGNAGARRKLLESFDTGKVFTMYFGHGGPSMLGKNKLFFTVGDALKLNNDHLGIMYFGGCTLSRTDCGERGLGEIMVTDATRGLVAAILASRTTWSGQNYDFARRLVVALLRQREAGNPIRTESPTLGEIFADAKNASQFSNELCYNLIGDPALRIPVAVKKIDIGTGVTSHCLPGSIIEISGKLRDADGNLDNSFNGEAAIKVMAPPYTAESRDIETGNTNNGKKINIRYADKRLLAKSVDVVNGQFNTKIVIPTDFKYVENDTLPLHIGAYDRSSHRGAAGYAELYITLDNPQAGDSKAILDTTAPEINIEYDEIYGAVSVTVYDKEGLNPGIGLSRCINLELDGDSFDAEAGLPDTGATGSQYTKRFYAHLLEDGEHTVSAQATDAAGNTSSSSLTFVKKSDATSLELRAGHAHTEAIEFEVSGEYTGALTLVITDQRGNHIWRGEVSGTPTWHCVDMQGKRVAPGHYRAKVTQTGVSHPRHSDWIEFGVID